MDFKVVGHTVYEVKETPVSLEEERKKLQWMEDCIAQDQAAFAEYNAKIEEVDALPIAEDMKQILKSAVIITASGVTPAELEAQRVRVALIEETVV